MSFEELGHRPFAWEDLAVPPANCWDVGFDKVAWENDGEVCEVVDRVHSLFAQIVDNDITCFDVSYVTVIAEVFFTSEVELNHDHVDAVTTNRLRISIVACLDRTGASEHQLVEHVGLYIGLE